MPGHNTSFKLFRSPTMGKDPGDGKTIHINKNPISIPIESGSSDETRTLAAPTKSGVFVDLIFDTDGGGDVTVTVTGGFNQAADTTILFSDVKDSVLLRSVRAGTSYTWNLVTFEGTDLKTKAAYKTAVQAAPETATGSATLTAAQLLSGILVGTPAAVATYTTLTGTQLKAALPANWALNDCFDLAIVNLGGAGDIITLAGGADVTVVGSATVDDAGTDINSSGLFRFRYSAANTFIAYRIA